MDSLILQTKHSFFLSLALGAGWLLSPESLVITGNSSGHMTWLTLPVLAIVALLFGLTARLLQQPQLSSRKGEEFTLLAEFTGTIPATALTIASSLPLIVLSATALLVTSGYTFNEVFLYWFPNFGFAFLLLAILTILQFCPEKILHRAQIFFVALAAGGLLSLCLLGFVKIGGATSQQVAELPTHFSWATIAPLFLLFAGSTLGSNRERPFLLPIAATVLFALWIVISLSYVTPDRLISSTIPYMTAARKILGDPGRQIMGAVVISGTCAAYTGLMLAARRLLATIIDSKSGSQLFSIKMQRWLLPTLLALITAILMATGLAGEELLEVLLRAALMLWLLHHIFLCISALVWLKKDSRLPLAGGGATLAMVAALFSLFISNAEHTKILIFSFSMLGISTLLALIWLTINKRRNHSAKEQETQ